MGILRMGLTIVIAIVTILVVNAFFIVDEREKALLLRFGEIVRTDFQAGLHFKVPFINNVRKFDSRVQTLDFPPETYLTKEKKKVKVDSFAKWRIFDLKKFYTSVGGSIDVANIRLAESINNGLRAEFGKRIVHEVVSGERSQITDIITASVRTLAMGKFGIDVIDVRLKRVDLPSEVNESVYRRMESERHRIAKELRSEGQEQSEKIRAESDRMRTILIAEAYRDAERVRGVGDAASANIYSTAYNTNKDFYRFYRSLTAYEKSFSNKNDVLLLDTKSRFFDFFGQKPDLR